MLYNVILNSSNVVSNTNNTQFKYKFLNGGLNITENSEICMCSSIIPYPSTLTLTLNDGFYTTQTISNALESFFQFNGLFFHKLLQQMDYKLQILCIPSLYPPIQTIIRIALHLIIFLR